MLKINSFGTIFVKTYPLRPLLYYSEVLFGLLSALSLVALISTPSHFSHSNFQVKMDFFLQRNNACLLTRNTGEVTCATAG